MINGMINTTRASLPSAAEDHGGHAGEHQMKYLRVHLPQRHLTGLV
jgi:hypothetical protein